MTLLDLFMIAAFLIAIIGLGWLLYVALRTRLGQETPYPFDDANFVHVGLTPAQVERLCGDPDFALLRKCPSHRNATVDAEYFALTRDEFAAFFQAVNQRTKVLIEEAAQARRKVLRGDEMFFSQLLIGLSEIYIQLVGNPEPVRIALSDGLRLDGKPGAA